MIKKKKTAILEYENVKHIYNGEWILLQKTKKKKTYDLNEETRLEKWKLNCSFLNSTESDSHFHT